MNPQSATLPAAPALVNGAASQAPGTAAADVSGVPAAPSIVTNIPVHTQQTIAAPAGEDAELDKIMQDVGHEMKKEDDKPQHHGFLGLGHKPKPLVKVASQPIRQQPPAAMPAAPLPAAVPQAQPQAAALPKPKTQHSIPVFVIFVAFLVTGFLVAAAVAAYRQS
jgi:hypothetical protein